MTILQETRRWLTFVCFAALAAACTQDHRAETAAIIITQDEKDPAVWGKKYPNHYDSYLKNDELAKGYSRYRNDNEDRLSPWPFQLVLFDGWGMGLEYNEPNGHTRMMQDQLQVDPSRKKPGGVCLTCKTSYAPALKQKMGLDYFRKPYLEVLAEIPKDHQGIGLTCADCHNPSTMELRISRWTLREALQSVGKDPDRLTRQELRSLVCAQCHVTYAIPKDAEGKSAGLLFPWKNGKWGDISADAVVKQIKDDHLGEWKHAVTNQKMGHIRHPEFELYASPSNVHWAAGVACADCHMPYERVGSEKMSSHRWESPLKKNMKACMQCHNHDAEWLKERVFAIQDRVNHMFTKAGYAAAGAALMIEAAEKRPGVDHTMLEKAKKIYQDAYYRVVWVGAENSMGFHNPPEALRVLGDGLDYAHKAENTAREALLKTGATPPGFDTAAVDRIVASRYVSTDGKTRFRTHVARKAAFLPEVPR